MSRSQCHRTEARATIAVRQTSRAPIQHSTRVAVAATPPPRKRRSTVSAAHLNSIRKRFPLCDEPWRPAYSLSARPAPPAPDSKMVTSSCTLRVTGAEPRDTGGAREWGWRGARRREDNRGRGTRRGGGCAEMGREVGGGWGRGRSNGVSRPPCLVCCRAPKSSYAMQTCSSRPRHQEVQAAGLLRQVAASVTTRDTKSTHAAAAAVTAAEQSGAGRVMVDVVAVSQAQGALEMASAAEQRAHVASSRWLAIDPRRHVLMVKRSLSTCQSPRHFRFPCEADRHHRLAKARIKFLPVSQPDPAREHGCVRSQLVIACMQRRVVRLRRKTMRHRQRHNTVATFIDFQSPPVIYASSCVKSSRSTVLSLPSLRRKQSVMPGCKRAFNKAPAYGGRSSRPGFTTRDKRRPFLARRN